jgi:uncharacterized membrane protein YebE (DUF533 family)
MFNPERLLGQLLQGGLSAGLGPGRKRSRGGSFLGGLSTGTKAQLGMGLLGVAIAAYEHHSRQGQGAAPPSEPLPPASPYTQPIPNIAHRASPMATEAQVPPQRSLDAMLLVQAMVAAAAADGVIDEAEKAQMLKRATDAGFDSETKRFLEQELTQPKSLAVIVAASRPEIATDVYAASCAAITADTDSERIYLETLAKRLGITEEARAEIHRQLDLA